MKAKFCLLALLALVVGLVFTFGAVAFADPSGGANHNPIGMIQGTYDPADWGDMSKGELQKSTVLGIRDNPQDYEGYTNFGLFLGWFKTDGYAWGGGGFKK